MSDLPNARARSWIQFTVVALIATNEGACNRPVAKSSYCSDGMQLPDSAAVAGTKPDAPLSPWLAFNGQPSKAAAIGVLGGGILEISRYSIIWADATSSQEPETSLIPTPEPWMLPTLGPLKWPAVFALSEGSALVFGRRGWGWTSANDGQRDLVQLFDQLLEERVRSLEEEAVQAPQFDSYLRHHTDLVLLEPQLLRSEPDEHASATVQADYVPVAHCGGGLLRKMESAPAAVDTLVLAPPVRIVKRRGDWAQVILPRRDRLWYMCLDQALISWERQPAGWARLYLPGPLPGTKLRNWRIEAWGIWP